MTLAGEPLAAGCNTALSPDDVRVERALFYLHWRYTMDETFLRERAYPCGHVMLAIACSGC